MAEEEIRVGLIGAGGNVRNRHIPGFRKVEGVQLLGVVNRSRESSHRVAEQFNIPRIYDHWQELLEDDAINAVCIGTWPYMHRTLTLAALEKGKHVLTEARIGTFFGQQRRFKLLVYSVGEYCVKLSQPFGEGGWAGLQDVG